MAASWHKLLLVGVLIVLAGLAGWIGFQYPGAIADLQAPLNKQAAGNKVPPLVPDAFAAQRDDALNPSQWQVPDSRNALFTPRRFLFFPATQKVQLATDDMKVGPAGGDSVTLGWLVKNALNASDPDITIEDADGDGFTNADEFKAGTDPRDPKAHPSYAQLLRIQSSDARPFRMTFSSKNAVGGEDVFQINTPDGAKSSSNVKVGQSFEGFKVVGFTPKQGSRTIGTMTVEGDISELELQNESTGAQVILVLHDEKNVPNVSALVVLLLPNTYNNPITVHQGKDFTLQASPKPEIPNETLHFQFVSIDDQAATFLNPETKATLLVPRLNPQELDRVKNRPAPYVPPTAPTP